MTLASGTKLGPYEIQSPPGWGGMGEVYRAIDTRLDLRFVHLGAYRRNSGTRLRVPGDGLLARVADNSSC